MSAISEPYSYRDDPGVPVFADERPIIIFDGKCVLCSGFVQFVLRHDPGGRLRFIAAQSELGASLYRHYGLDPVDYETNILLEDGRVWFKSSGSIRMLRLLGFPWSMVAVFGLLPTALRDWLYDGVARHRLQWFGVRETCLLPEAADADRFLG